VSVPAKDDRVRVKPGRPGEGLTGTVVDVRDGFVYVVIDLAVIPRHWRVGDERLVLNHDDVVNLVGEKA